jgi:hypothetical protein
VNTLLSVIETYTASPPRHASLPVQIPNVGRDDLPALFRELGFTTGAEIGVEKGIYSETLCKAGLTLTCVDSWIGLSGSPEPGRDMEASYEETVRRLTPYGCTILRMTSREAAAKIEDGSLDFVYIDAAHDLFHVIEDIHLWTPKVRIGGIIAGHDYRKSQHAGSPDKRARNTSHHVAEAVNAYTESYDIRPWFVLGRKDRRKGEKRDRERSWFWIRTF